MVTPHQGKSTFGPSQEKALIKNAQIAIYSALFDEGFLSTWTQN
jgi:hypothetical protein